jgi:hypothetical protein
MTNKRRFEISIDINDPLIQDLPSERLCSVAYSNGLSIGSVAAASKGVKGKYIEASLGATRLRSAYSDAYFFDATALCWKRVHVLPWNKREFRGVL